MSFWFRLTIPTGGKQNTAADYIPTCWPARSTELVFHMTLLSSRLGFALALVYLAVAGRIVWWELHHSGGGWINLRSLGTTLVTAPSQATVGYLFRFLGVKQVNFNKPGASGYAQLVIHLLFSAIVIYFLGYGIEWGGRRLLMGMRG